MHLSLSAKIRYSHLDPKTGIANVRASARENVNANANNNVNEHSGSKSATENNRRASASIKGRFNGPLSPPSPRLQARPLLHS